MSRTQHSDRQEAVALFYKDFQHSSPLSSLPLCPTALDLSLPCPSPPLHPKGSAASLPSSWATLSYTSCLSFCHRLLFSISSIHSPFSLHPSAFAQPKGPWSTARLHPVPGQPVKQPTVPSGSFAESLILPPSEGEPQTLTGDTCHCSDVRVNVCQNV